MTTMQPLAAWGSSDRDDPFPLFADVRALGAVHAVTLADDHDAWLVVRCRRRSRHVACEDHPMRCPVLVGRQTDLDQLRRSLEGLPSGKGTWTTVVGEAGVGKTRLVTELITVAEQRGVLTVVGRCSATDRASPYRPVAEALLAVTRDVARPADEAIAPYAAALAQFVPHWRERDAGGPPESPAVLGESLLQVLRWRANGRGALLVLEDLHWADDETAAVCTYMADHVASAGVSVVATMRPEDTGAPRRTDLTRHSTVALGRLTDDEVTQVAEACLGQPPSSAVLEQLHRSAAGLPLLVEDLLDGTAGAGSRFGVLMRHRFEGMSEMGRRVTVATALLGERFGWPILLGLQSAGVIGAETLDEPLACGLIERDDDGFRFRHALTRDVVLDAAPVLAHQLSAPVASALERLEAVPPLVRAADLYEAAGDSAKAVSLLERAVEAMGHDGSGHAVLPLLARASALTTEETVRDRIDIDRLVRLADRGMVDEASTVGSALLHRLAGADRRRSVVHVALARCCLAAGRPEDAGRHLDTVGGSSSPDALVLRARLALQSPAVDRRTVAEHLAHQAVAAAELAGRYEVACEALELAGLCARTRSLADATDRLERALDVADQHALGSWRLRLLNELGTIDMLRTTDATRLRAALDAALHSGALDVAAGTMVNIAALHAMRGELDETRSAAQRAYEDASRLGLWPLAAAALVMEALSYGFRGERQPMERRLRDARRLAPDDADLDAFAWGAGRGLCALLREERDEALIDFDRAMRDDAPIGSLDTARGPLLLLQTVAHVDPRIDADDAHATATPGAGWSDLWLGYADAAIAGAAGDCAKAVALFDTADAAARRHPLFRAIGLRLVSEAALRDAWGEPAQWLRDAEATFVTGGQDRIAAACRGLLRQAGEPATRRRGADRRLPSPLLTRGVTAREAEVLELIGERLPNREIANRLFVSPRTVEKHVSSLLQKLEAADRAALARMATEL